MNFIKTTFLFIFLFLLFNKSIGQEEKIGTINLKAGIYKNFEELKSNSPSLSLEYEILPMVTFFGVSSKKMTRYKIDIDKKNGKEIGKIYGFCDGINIYINKELQRLHPKARFYKINFLGDYSYYESFSSNAYQYYHVYQRILNMHTGEIKTLTPQYLREIIGDDGELVNLYDLEEDKVEKMKEYLFQYFNYEKN